jgi:hypothetical protein
VHLGVCPVAMFFHNSQTSHSVQNNAGYDAMSSCNCTSNIVTINVDTVYDMHGRIWKCEVHIWIHRRLA